MVPSHHRSRCHHGNDCCGERNGSPGCSQHAPRSSSLDAPATLETPEPGYRGRHYHDCWLWFLLLCDQCRHPRSTLNLAAALPINARGRGLLVNRRFAVLPAVLPVYSTVWFLVNGAKPQRIPYAGHGPDVTLSQTAGALDAIACPRDGLCDFYSYLYSIANPAN